MRENDALRHVQPPETAGRIVTTSPGDERRVEPVAVAHVRRVHEQVDVAAHRAGLVADAAVQRRVAPLELLEDGAHARGRQRELRGALAVGAQRRRNMDRDGHGSGHVRSTGASSFQRVFVFKSDPTPCFLRASYVFTRIGHPTERIEGTHLIGPRLAVLPAEVPNADSLLLAFHRSGGHP